MRGEHLRMSRDPLITGTQSTICTLRLSQPRGRRGTASAK
jgi:hypothetical protein